MALGFFQQTFVTAGIMVLVAASGNAGPKSPPLYPAANPNVIAVSATDAHDRLYMFVGSSRSTSPAIPNSFL